MQEFKLPRECYVTQPAKQQIESESNEYWELEKLVWDDGVHLYVRGAMFPYKSFVEPETLFAVNIVKSLFIESVKIGAMWQFIPSILLVSISVKSIQNILERFNRLAWRVISPYILKDRYLTRATKELQFCIFTFLHQLGIAEEVADRFSSIFSHLIEYDNAYRLRVEDIMTEANKYFLWKDPRKEIKRLMGIVSERDANPVSQKVQKLVSIILLALYIPKVKKAFRRTVEVMNKDNLSLDDNDIYWSCMRKDYKFLGLEYEKRQEYAKNRGWVFPQQLKD